MAIYQQLPIGARDSHSVILFFSWNICEKLWAGRYSHQPLHVVLNLHLPPHNESDTLSGSSYALDVFTYGRNISLSTSNIIYGCIYKLRTYIMNRRPGRGGRLCSCAHFQVKLRIMLKYHPIGKIAVDISDYQLMTWDRLTNVLLFCITSTNCWFASIWHIGTYPTSVDGRVKWLNSYGESFIT